MFKSRNASRIVLVQTNCLALMSGEYIYADKDDGRLGDHLPRLNISFPDLSFARPIKLSISDCT